MFKLHSNFQNFDEIFYCSMARMRNTNLDVSYNVSTQELFQERKIRDRVCLENIQNF